MGRFDAGRVLETGTVLAVLTVSLVVTGVLLSPTLTAGIPRYTYFQTAYGNALYAAHVATGTALVAYALWHLTPWSHQFSRKSNVSALGQAVSYVLLAIVALEAYTGVVLWFRLYDLVGKRQAVAIHLGGTAAILAPFVWHLSRGVNVWLERRQAARFALAAASAKGKVDIARDAQGRVSRRRFVRLAAVAAGAFAVASLVGRFATHQVMAWRLNFVGDAPDLTKENWRLRVTGAVARPIELTYDDLLAFPRLTMEITHRCVEGWTYTDEFTGVPLRRVVERAGGLLPGAAQFVFKSPEVSKQRIGRGRKYTSNFPVEDGLHEDVLLVFQVAGEDLPKIHGGPVRIMTPRKWGYKACKWLTEVEVTPDAHYRGYWETLGYNNDGDYPGPIFE